MEIVRLSVHIFEAATVVKFPLLSENGEAIQFQSNLYVNG